MSKTRCILAIFSIWFLCMGCKSNFVLLSSIKEKVIPGRPNIPSTDNYILNFETKTNAKITIDRIEIRREGKCYVCNYSLMESKNPAFLKEITKAGNYILNVPLLKDRAISITDCNSSKEQLVVYYKENGTKKNLTVSTFSSTTKTMR